MVITIFVLRCVLLLFSLLAQVQCARQKTKKKKKKKKPSNEKTEESKNKTTILNN